MATIGVEELSAEISKELQMYSKNVTDNLKKATKKYARILVKKTKENAPVGKRKSSKYRDSIKSKKQAETPNSIRYVWYVDSKSSNYRLTHLLVNGHALRNGGRTSPNPFLKNAVSEVESDYHKEIEEIVENG